MKLLKGASRTSSIVAGLIIFAIVGVGIYLFSGQNTSTLPGDPKNGDTQSVIEHPLELTSHDWQRGSFDHKVTLIEYADFECPACGAYYPLIKELEKDYSGKLLVVFRQFPLLQVHKNALPAARAAEAAGRQGKFFEMHDMIYEHQADWSESDTAPDIFKTYAKTIGLNVDQYTKDLSDKSIDDNIKFSLQTVDQLKINSTPTFFINGKKIANPLSYEEFKQQIENAPPNNTDTRTDITEPASTLETQTQATQEHKEAFHEHSDFKVYLKGKAVDFSQAQYQSDKNGKELDEYVHLHDGNGNVIHFHKAGITLGYFFKSLNINFQKGCFNFSLTQNSCDASNLKLYVNGKINDQFEKYNPHDLDHILITDAIDQKEIDKELASLTNDACLYSEKCPERGKPPTESCVGGLGTGCTQ